MNIAEDLIQERRSYEVNLKPFPSDVFPKSLEGFAECVALNVQVSLDMVAVPLLAALCIPLQNRFVVRIDSTYAEPLCLYTLTIARPSERKSAIISILEKPFWKYQRHASETLLAMGQKPLTLYVTDATPEKLARLMEENRGAIALLSDEPDALSVAAGLRYGKGKNLGLMLQAWSAGRVMISRATDDKRISIDRAVMSVAVMSQPSFVEELVKDGEMSSRGFLQRFLFSEPLSMVGKRVFRKPEIPQELIDGYERLIEDFLEMDTESLREIRLSEEAKNVAEEIFNAIEVDIGKNPVLEGWMGKLFGQLLRIAGVLHCAKWGTEAAEHKIEVETMCNVAKLGDYFISHAKAAFTDVDMNQEVKDARELYRFMREYENRYEGKFTKSDLYRITHGKMPKARLEPALVKLIEAQYLALLNTEGDDKTRVYVLLGSRRGIDESELD